MREDVEFNADGVALRGWFYTPDGASGPVPTIVMAHGFSAVKEMYLDRFAEAFAEAGLAALVYDNRNFGASDGEPRQEIDPWAQVRDYRTAITYATTRPEVDADRIGIWGSSARAPPRARGRGWPDRCACLRCSRRSPAGRPAPGACRDPRCDTTHLTRRSIAATTSTCPPE